MRDVRFLAVGFVFIIVAGIGLAGFAAPASGARGGGGKGEFAAIDRHALAAPKSAERSIKRLARYLTRPAKNDLQKARAIYRWITHNIAYDANAFFSGSFRNQRVTPADALKSRKGVCDGYARLFESLGKAAGLKVVKVSGYAKGFGYVPGQDVPSQSNHAWNAVRINGRWALMDPTWGAGGVNKKSRRFERRFKEHYFRTAPKEMIYDHLPEDPKWQLLKKKVSRSEYSLLPQLRPGFFRRGLKLDSHRTGLIETDDRVAVSLLVPHGVSMVSTLLAGDKELGKNLTYVRREGGRINIHALFPRPGKYVLRLFAKRGGPKGAYDMAMNYIVRARKGTGDRFPIYGNTFFAHGLKLVSHPDGVIRTDGKVEIGVAAPAGVDMTADVYKGKKKLPGNLRYLRREGKIYKIHALFPAPGAYKLRIFSRRNKRKGRYGWALDYQVKARKGTSEKFPVYHQTFFDHGLKLISHKNGVIKTGGRLDLRVGAPRDVQLLASLLRGKREAGKGLTFLQREGGEYRLRVALPKRGAYTLRLFSKRGKAKDSFSWAMDYAVVASKGAGAQAGFPTIYNTFRDKGAALEKPLARNLKSGTKQTFRLKVPGADKVSVVRGGKWTHLKKRGGLFEGQVLIGKGKIVVFANFSGGKGSWAGLLEYRGR